jgi:nucleotide-binding universal stress UspA family protein
MGYPDSPGPVVVGIDGSRAAIGAAQWAVDEAVTRDVALRLVHLIHMAGATPDATDEDFRLEVEYAESALRAAHLAVEASGQPVKVETAVLRGDLVNILVEESSDATMICVGSSAGSRAECWAPPPPHWPAECTAPWRSSGLIPTRRRPTPAGSQSSLTTSPTTTRSCIKLSPRRNYGTRVSSR